MLSRLLRSTSALAGRLAAIVWLNGKFSRKPTPRFRAVVLCVIAPSFSLPLGVSAAPTWAQTFGVDAISSSTQGQDIPLSVAAMPDGGVVVLGKLSFASTRPDHPEF